MSSSQPVTIRLAGTNAYAQTNFDVESQVGLPYDLDWRTAPTPVEIRERLWKVLNRLDYEGIINVVMSSGVAGRQYARRKTGDTTITKVNRGAQLELFDADGNTVEEEDAQSDTSRGWVYRLRTCVKRCGGRDTEYLCKFITVAKETALIIEKFDPELRRGAGYDMDNEAFDKNQALNIFTDLALTIGVHPAALGISPASTGECFLPKGYFLQVTTCTNVFEYNRDRHLQQNSGLRTAKKFDSYSIDPMIHSLKLRHDKTFSEAHRIRAVVVIEHRNLRETMGNLVRKETADWRGLLFVLVRLLCFMLLHIITNYV